MRPVAPSAPAPTQAPAQPPPAAPVITQRFADADPGYAFADPTRNTKLTAAFPKIDIAIADEMKRQNVQGLALGIVIDGELAYSKGYGVADLEAKTAPDADTVYRIGSISKSFTALAILALRDDGALTLDDPLTKWIPEARNLIYPTHDSQPITLRRLLDHTSGMPRDTDFTRTASEQTFLPLLDNLALENPANQQWSYSNFGFALLGIVAAHTSHGTLEALLHKRVFAPLGMTSTVLEPSAIPKGRLAPAYLPDGKPMPKLESLGVAAGAGGIFSTVRDMARYLALQLSAYPPRSDRDTGVVRRSTLREAHATGTFHRAAVRLRASKKGEPSVNLDAAAYGFGWSHSVDCKYDDVVGHDGAIDNYRASAKFLTRRGVGVVVLTNFGNANTSAFADRALDELAATGALARYVGNSKPAPALDANMKAFLAVYNQYDEAALEATLARPPDPVEQDELAGYFKLHGTCTAATPVEVSSPLNVRFKLTCERGAFELAVNAATDGRLLGFLGTSRDVPVPAEVTTASKNVLSLLARWDDNVFKRAFVDPSIHDLLRTGSDALRAEVGTCKPRTFIREGFAWRLEATCDRGPDRRFDLQLEGAKIKSVLTRPIAESTCPLK